MTTITIEAGGVRLTLSGDPLRLMVSPDDETIATLARLESQGGRLEKGLIAMSQLVTDLQAALATAQTKLDEATAKLAEQDGKTDAIVQLVTDLRDQVAALNVQIASLNVTPAEKQALTDAAAKIQATAAGLSDKLGTEGAQLDAVLTPPA